MPSPEIDRMIQQQVDDLYQRHLALGDADAVRFYPPEMESERDRLGIAYTALNGRTFHAGDYDYSFPIQSISKVFAYGLALEDNGREETLKRVGVEPSGDPYNSLTYDERHNRPYNPMVNAGALVAINLVHGANGAEKTARVLDTIRRCAANPSLAIDQSVLAMELDRANDRNMGLSYLMRSLGMLTGDVEENIEVYLAICSVRVTAQDLATMGATLAKSGVNPFTNERVFSRSCVRDMLTVMSTCGMYDYAGEWAYDVGIPAKSGVSGGIFAAMPNSFGGGFFSPGLDENGNSVRCVRLCRDLSERFGLHVFADPEEERLGLTIAQWAAVGQLEDS